MQLKRVPVYRADEETRRKIATIDKGKVTWYSIQTEWLNMVLLFIVLNADSSHKDKVELVRNKKMEIEIFTVRRKYYSSYSPA